MGLRIPFNFDKYNVGGNGASASDEQLTGEEVFKAARDGWTVWDGFTKNDRAMRTNEAVDRLFVDFRRNNTPSDTDKRLDAGQDYMSWAMGNFDTEDVISHETNGNVTVVKKKFIYADGKFPNIVEREVINTFYVKNNNDGTTEIVLQDWDGKVRNRTLIDNRAGKEMVQVLEDFDYTGYDRNAQWFDFKLGDFVKNIREAQKLIKQPLENVIHYMQN